MAEKFELEHGGQKYTVERGEPRHEAAIGGGAPVGTDSWYIKLNLAAVTSLQAVPDEGRAALEARIHRWLDEHPEPLGGAGIVLGGG